ncbi:MAG: BolA family transcriptional regulator [Gammaproteobacteria bacterium]|jgi:acid stress-induced BolA-like protein IbaG/YrbA
MHTDEIKQLIEAGLPGATVEVDGDGTHFTALVVSGEFEGMSMVQKHQRVYRTLGEKMGTDIHALSIQAYTPDEWERKKDFRVISG